MESPAPSENGQSAPVSAKILVVEDEAGIADFLERGLRAAGFEVQLALDGTTGERARARRGARPRDPRHDAAGSQRRGDPRHAAGAQA